MSKVKINFEIADFINNKDDVKLKLITDNDKKEKYRSTEDFTVQSLNFTGDKKCNMVLVQIEYGGCGPEDYTNIEVYKTGIKSEDFKRYKNNSIFINKEDDIKNIFSDKNISNFLKEKLDNGFYHAMIVYLL